MKCSSLRITGAGEDRFDVIAGLPVQTEEGKRPSILVGRSYQVGNAFQTFDESIGVRLSLTDELIRSPESMNLDRLLRGVFRPAVADGDSDVIDIEVFGGEDQGHLLSLCVEGYRDLQVRFNSPEVELLCEADVTLSGAYFVDRGTAYLLALKPGAKITMSYGVPEKEVTVHQGDKWWHLTRWLPYETSEWVTRFHDIEVSLDDDGCVVCQVV